jgi:hypothetical protein
VSLARFAAFEGIPIPTKHTEPLRNIREATTVIISDGVGWFIELAFSRREAYATVIG